MKPAWRNGRGFIALDAAFTKTSFEYVLMLAAGYDGANQLVVYAWAIVPSETYESWAWFCRMLNLGLGSIDRGGTTVINDRQKVSPALPVSLLTLFCHSKLTSRFGRV